MKERTKELLKHVIEEYIGSAEPVGSKFLVESGKVQVSAATVRNELRELEEKGYLTHPHTSAGRIPTEAGYKYYVENLATEKPLTQKGKTILEKDLQTITDKKQKTKEIAKRIAEVSKNAVIVTFGRHSVYYTGISYLFAQPEFRDFAHTISVSTLFDQCEERVDDVIKTVGLHETKILIGSENPLGSQCSTVVSRFGNDNVFALVGPMRMHYSYNQALVTYSSSLIV